MGGHLFGSVPTLGKLKTYAMGPSIYCINPRAVVAGGHANLSAYARVLQRHSPLNGLPGLSRIFNLCFSLGPFIHILSQRLESYVYPIPPLPPSYLCEWRVGGEFHRVRILPGHGLEPFCRGTFLFSEVFKVYHTIITSKWLAPFFAPCLQVLAFQGGYDIWTWVYVIYPSRNQRENSYCPNLHGCDSDLLFDHQKKLGGKGGMAADPTFPGGFHGSQPTSRQDRQKPSPFQD